jgi:hypothetical protein
MADVWGEESPAEVTVEVKVNGEVVGNADPDNTLGAVAHDYSVSHGLKTFNVLVNGAKADTAQGNQTLRSLGATSVELVAKEARG